MKIYAQSGLIKGFRHVVMVDLDVGDVATPEFRHTILIEDCSVSMGGNINDLKSDSQKYLSELGDNDFASVIVFSGHDRAKLIAGPTQCNHAGRELLKQAVEKEVRVMDTTVFSEPLVLTLQTVERLARKDMLHHAVLFTDGCAMPSRWSVDAEEQKAFSVVRALDEAGASVSVIGYGVHYNQDFMETLTEAAGYTGIYRHISDIEDFGPAIVSADEVFRDTRPVNFDLAIVPAKGPAGRVFKTTPELTSIGDGGHVRTRGAYQGKTTLFVELTQECDEFTIRGRMNGQKVEQTVKATALTPESAKSYAIAKAAYLYITGDSAGAVEILINAGADGLAEKAGSSYTPREKRETADEFRRMFRDRKHIGEGLKPKGPNHNVLNVLRALMEDEGNVVYLGKGAYKRSGEMTRDPRIIPSPLGKTMRVVGYRSHKARFNFSVQCVVDAKVLPENGGPAEDKKLHRTFNIILDGNLHTPELEAVLTDKSFADLQSAGVIGAVEKHVPGKCYTLNLRNIKMISGNWSNPATLGLVKLMQEEAELKAEQTALNARIGATVPSGEDDGEEDEFHHGRAEKVQGVPVETYEAGCVEYRLMKYKAGSYAEAAAKMSHAQAGTRVKQVRQRLITVRYLKRAIIFAMEVTGSKAIAWDAGKGTQRGTYPKLEQNAAFQGASLKRVTWREQFACS
ncbi:VWA domain-containing protein [Candidatus Uhrbacteria bacterium]|nr:VWA domain-containing protein [Candidatus Uhrbacteria bacterium]